MMDSLPELMERYRQHRLQLVFVADGDRQTDLRRLVQQIGTSDRIAVCDFNACRHRLAYGGADFVLMPLAFDPCALPCKIGQRYGALPIAYDTGAIHDCVEHLNLAENTGNGFLFTYFDVNGFLWAMDQAMDFYRQSAAVRSIHVQRIMTDSLKKLNREGAILRLIEHYRRVLYRFPEKKKPRQIPQAVSTPPLQEPERFGAKAPWVPS